MVLHAWEYVCAFFNKSIGSLPLCGVWAAVMLSGSVVLHVRMCAPYSFGSVVCGHAVWAVVAASVWASSVLSCHSVVDCSRWKSYSQACIQSGHKSRVQVPTDCHKPTCLVHKPIPQLKHIPVGTGWERPNPHQVRTVAVSFTPQNTERNTHCLAIYHNRQPASLA